MLRAYHALAGLRDLATFDVWLRRIVANAARSYLAEEERERRKARRLQALDRPADESPDDDGPAVRAESSGFDALVAGLGLEERTVLAFRLVEELPYPEIARILGVTESGAKMRYRRAIERLRLRFRV